MNLLPETEKEAVEKGLRLRFLVVALLMVAGSFAIGFTMLLPSYFLTPGHLFQMSPEGFMVDSQNSDSDQKMLGLPDEIDSKLKFVQSNISTASAVYSIGKIVSLLPAGIHLNSINFSRNQIYNNNAGILIAVSGIAQNRDSLASFVSALRDSGSFSSVDLPVSDLAKGDNLPFSIQIFIKN